MTYLLILSVLLSAVPLNASAAQNASSKTNAGPAVSDKLITSEKAISRTTDIQVPKYQNTYEVRNCNHMAIVDNDKVFKLIIDTIDGDRK